MPSRRHGLADGGGVGRARMIAQWRIRAQKQKTAQDVDGFCLGIQGNSGRGERIRTSGLYVPNVALYQAKLHPDLDCGGQKVCFKTV